MLWLPVVSWALYDFANTIFSMNVISRYFPLWVQEDIGVPDLYYSLTYSLSMLLVAVSLPFLGKLSDISGKRKPFLIVLTLLSVISTFLIGYYGGLWSGLFFFLLANFFFQCALVPYNALLPYVSRHTSRGKVSGLGVGLGYLGTIAGLVMVWPFVSYDVFQKIPSSLRSFCSFFMRKYYAAGGEVLRINAFIPTAILFLIFSLPAFIFIKEKAVPAKKSDKTVQPFSQLIVTFKSLKSSPSLGIFILANFIYMDVIHTVIVFMSVYSRNVIDFSDDKITIFLIVSTVFAIVGSFFYGWFVSETDPKLVLHYVLGNWTLGIAVALLAYSETVFWTAGSLIGFGLGGVWVTARLVLIELCPEERLGEFFGLYGLTGKCAAVIGPALWGVSTYVFSSLGDTKYRISIGLMLVLLIGGWVVYSRIDVNP